MILKSHAVIKDSIFATVGDKVIPRSDIINEIKTILILNGKSYSEDIKQQLNTAAVKTIIQRTVKEIEVEKYPNLEFSKDELNQKLNVDGEATFQDNVIINANNKFFKIQTESSVDKFTVDTDNGNTEIKGTLDVDDVATFNEDVNFIGDNYNLLWDKSQNSLEFKDETKATFGDGRDLQISHTNSLASQTDSNGDSITDDWASFIHENYSYKSAYSCVR